MASAHLEMIHLEHVTELLRWHLDLRFGLRLGDLPVATKQQPWLFHLEMHPEIVGAIMRAERWPQAQYVTVFPQCLVV